MFPPSTILLTPYTPDPKIASPRAPHYRGLRRAPHYLGVPRTSGVPGARKGLSRLLPRSAPTTPPQPLRPPPARPPPALPPAPLNSSVLTTAPSPPTPRPPAHLLLHRHCSALTTAPAPPPPRPPSRLPPTRPSASLPPPVIRALYLAALLHRNCVTAPLHNCVIAAAHVVTAVITAVLTVAHVANSQTHTQKITFVSFISHNMVSVIPILTKRPLWP